MNKYVLIIMLCGGVALFGSCAGSKSLSKTEMTYKNHRKSRAKQAPINSLLYAKRYWKPHYKRDSFLSFLSKKPVKKAKPKPEYTHE